MKPFLANWNPQLYAAMRIVVGFLFLWHGTQKLFGFPSPVPPGTPAFVVYGAGAVELVGGVLVLLGLFTGWAAFIASGEMAVAYWMAHASQGLLPIVNKGELAVLYCFVFLYISSRGGGIWSLDALLAAKRGHAPEDGARGSLTAH